MKSTLTHEQYGYFAQCFSQWLRIKATHEKRWQETLASGDPVRAVNALDPDLWHSALLYRMAVEGKEPLPVPPPLRNSYPDYAAVEGNGGLEMEVAVGKAQAFIPYSTQLIRDLGPLPGDEEDYALRTKPYREGILSERRLHDKRVTRERLIQDSKALRHALRWAVEDLVDYKSWGEQQAKEATHARKRIEEIFSYLTQEEKERVWARSAGVRAANGG